VDYREQLSAEEFAVFSRLRDERKKWAEAEGVPVYTIFTNAQLAAMVRQRVTTAAALGGIDGIGPARVAKYGDRLLAVLADLSAPAEATP
jgi:superfamily II DNA helicase RecQ